MSRHRFDPEATEGPDAAHVRRRANNPAPSAWSHPFSSATSGVGAGGLLDQIGFRNPRSRAGYERHRRSSSSSEGAALLPSQVGLNDGNVIDVDESNDPGTLTEEAMPFISPSSSAAAAATATTAAAVYSSAVGYRSRRGRSAAVMSTAARLSEAIASGCKTLLSGSLLPRLFGAATPTLVARTVSLSGEAVPEFAVAADAPPGQAPTPRPSSSSPFYFVPNLICNQKYTLLTFVPKVLHEQFRFFFNLYFLIVALTQFIPALKLGFLFTYIAPLIFVLSVTMVKEAFDDIKRGMRDKEVNSQRYTTADKRTVRAGDIRVGDIILVHANQRVPADGVLLQTTERGGACFVRTDQLDGETDWKLRHAMHYTQSLSPSALASTAGATTVEGMENTETETSLAMEEGDSAATDAGLALLAAAGDVYAEAPRREIYEFVGTFTSADGTVKEPLGLENTIWADCVVAGGTAVLLVVYTGRESRAVLNANPPRTKVGLLDQELNHISKVLFAFMLLLALVLVMLKGFRGLWYIYLFRFVLLFSSIIPISLRVNLDMGKTMYSYFMMKDRAIPGTVVRNSSIPEELGRISYLLSDKTGTLTQNDMVFKKLHLGSISFSRETLMHVKKHLMDAYDYASSVSSATRKAVARRSEPHYELCQAVRDAMLAIAICHNVTPVHVTSSSNSNSNSNSNSSNSNSNSINSSEQKEYQASSPDEIALVRFAEQVGLSLEDRTLTTLTLRNPLNIYEEYEILQSFPFTSERKRAGIIVRSQATGEIFFFLKGADTAMQNILSHSEWLGEECDNLAREGLRTLVVARRQLTSEEYVSWLQQYTAAKLLVGEMRASEIDKAVSALEMDMSLLGVTGVEDRLQNGVPEALEKLKNSGVRVWMLTGDKVDTAVCVGRASRLFGSRSQPLRIIQGTRNVGEIRSQLADISVLSDYCLVVDGTVLDVCLSRGAELRREFFSTACEASAVAVCRCSPTQKAQVVRLLKEHSPQKRICSIGDGGNDVAMITAADVGVGIVGKEGRQASLAADFSILQFSYITRLLLWHGRNSYKRSARLSQFVIHRGLTISVIQAVFSAIFYYAAIPIYTGWLMVGYATYYTMFPVFSMILDTDVDVEIALLYPELYRELQKGRSLSNKTFLTWVLKSVYQGAAIMVLAVLFFEDSFLRIVSITFTSLILTELLMVAFEVQRITRYMCIAELGSFVIYLVSIVLLPTYFDTMFIFTLTFWWKVSVITACSVVPVYLFKIVHRRLNPPAYSKLVAVV